jgi:hypothetical protein
MTESSRNNASKTPGRGRGRPFEKGNAGRPKGARHRATLAAESLLDGEAEALTRKAINLALLADDTTALRLCLERILPPRRERPVHLKLGTLQSAADAAGAMATITAAVAASEITSGQAAELSKLVEAFVKALEASDFEQRLRAVEAKGVAT